MGSKQDKVKVEEPKQEVPVTTVPTEPGREPQVAKEQKQSFDERTPGTAPFIREDGSQDNGEDK